MERFKYLAHTSEMKFQAFGRSLDEAFGNAALAMTNFVTPTDTVKVKKHKKIHVTGSRKESLLYDFLDEVLFLMDTIHFLTAKVQVDIVQKKVKGVESFVLTATLGGDDEDTYPLKGEIKAITYNDMQIKEEKDKVMVQVVCDI